jgi:DNA-binding winged helix-turn-helix (wHTH) protein
MSEPRGQILRFGVFELDTQAEQLRKNGLTIRLQPQPFRLLTLLVSEAGKVVTREDIRAALWKGDTFVDFEQGVNFAVKQVREALDDVAERSLYVQTVPRRGYRFVAPVEVVRVGAAGAHGTDLRLHKALWENIVELRLAEESRRRRRKIMIAAAIVVVAALAAFLLIRGAGL